MTRSLGPALPPALVARFAQQDLGPRLGVALPFVTVDADGRPHPMLLSYLEVRAYDAGTLGLVIGARSRSAKNLVERGTGTLLVVEPDLTVYVKTRAVDGPLRVEGGGELDLGYFLLAVEEVLEDAAAEWEGGMRITAAIRYQPAPTLAEPWARATLAALAEPRARA
ncbi:MAG: pyridoxamine 5'-phosphate oxidase family protein [Candidatus Rokubacteria bacterium]|nr:pyridoxamine 5'-phosphate oxidase family protein [Candidatus Rokubacteria bacterium]